MRLELAPFDSKRSAVFSASFMALDLFQARVIGTILGERPMPARVGAQRTSGLLSTSKLIEITPITARGQAIQAAKCRGKCAGVAEAGFESDAGDR
jgi:hypothetical protein